MAAIDGPSTAAPPTLRPRAWAFFAAAALALAAAGVSAAIALHGARDDPALVACVRALATAAPILAGLYTWYRRERARFGALLVITGAVSFVTTLAESPDATAYSVGRIAGWFVVVLVVALALAFPTGRLSTRTDRRLVLALAGAAGALYLPRAVVAADFELPSPFTSCSRDCPPNAFFVLHEEPAIVGDVMVPAGVALIFALTIATAARLYARHAEAGTHARRVLAPVLAVGGVMIALVGVGVAFRYAGPTSVSVQAVSWVLALTLPAISVAFLVGLVRSRLFAGRALEGLALCLRTDPDARVLRRAFAEAFEDPSIDILFPSSDGRARWTDSAGRVTGLPVARRGVTTVRHDGRLVAAVTHDPVLLGEPELLSAGTAMAGMVLDNQRLAAEARASMHEISESRARLAASTVEERRRIERDLHDGAQQRLVALRIELGLAEDLARRDPEEAAALMHELEREVEQALDDLRALTHGIHPPLLADRGLVEALRAAAARIPIPVEVDAYGIERYAPETESAVYFCVLESLQNVLKHAAGARRVAVSLDGGHHTVRFSVRDDGSGAPGGELRPGAGMRNMADRVAAVGGAVEVTSTPRVGTVVRGRVPTRPADADTPTMVVPT
jgi:signal transduction histidine kinase